MSKTFLVSKDILGYQDNEKKEENRKSSSMLVVPNPRRLHPYKEGFESSHPEETYASSSHPRGGGSPRAVAKEQVTPPKQQEYEPGMKPSAMSFLDSFHGVGSDPTSRGQQRSPNDSAATPPKIFDHFQWARSPLGYPGLGPHLNPYFSFRVPGFPVVPPNVPLMSAADQLHLNALHDPIFAYNSLRALFPPHHFFPQPSFGFPQSPSIPEKMFSEAKLSPSSTTLQSPGKLSASVSAFEPVLTKCSLSPVSPSSSSNGSGGSGELDLSCNAKVKAKESEPTRYHCDACSKSYSTYSGLSKHKQFHCSPQVQKEFSCKYCDKTYVSLGALKMHIRTHTLPCKCKLCGKAFSRPWLLQGHVRTHTGEKPFRCDHCGRAFADRSNLRAHLQTHSEVKKYSCKTCSKTFSRMSLLLKHEDGCGSVPMS